MTKRRVRWPRADRLLDELDWHRATGAVVPFSDDLRAKLRARGLSEQSIGRLEADCAMQGYRDQERHRRLHEAGLAERLRAGTARPGKRSASPALQHLVGRWFEILLPSLGVRPSTGSGSAMTAIIELVAEELGLPAGAVRGLVRTKAGRMSQELASNRLQLVARGVVGADQFTDE